MNRFLRWARWISAAFTILFVLAILGVLIYTQTDSFRRLIEEKALAAVNQSINGSISWQRLEGSLLGSVRLHELRVRYRDRDVFRTVRADVGYALLPLLWGRVQITRLYAANPWLELRKDADGEWTIVEALSSSGPPGEPSEWVFAINGIAIENGEVLFEPEAAKPDIYRLRALNLKGDVKIANGVDARISQAGAWIEAPGAPQIYARGALTYSQTENTESVELNKFWLQTERSRIMVTGTVKDFDVFDTALQVSIPHLAGADLTPVVPDWPADVDVRGSAAIHGTANDLQNSFKLSVAGAAISVRLRIDLVSTEKLFSGNAAMAGLEIAKVMPGKNISGVAAVDVTVSGSASDLESIKGAGSASLQSTMANGIALGTIETEGSFTARAVQLAGGLEGPIGQASWRGRLAFGAEPDYRVELTVPSLKADQIAPFNLTMPAEISFKGLVQGSGFDPQTMNARADLDLLPTRVGEVAISDGKILGRLSQGVVQIEHLRLRATEATLSAKGTIGVDLARPGRLEYRLDVANLTPWLQLVERDGSGRLQLAGSASGNLARLQTRGAMTLNAISVGELGLDSGKIDFTLERASGRTFPSGDVRLALGGIRAGLRLAQLQATIKLPADADQTIAVSANAKDSAGRVQRLSADVEQEGEILTVNTRELLLSLPDGNWELAEPATVRRSGDDYSIERLTLRKQAQLVSVSGRFSLSGSQALDATIERLSLATLFAYQPKPPDATGALSARLQIRGTAAAPVIDAGAELVDSKIAGQPYEGMRVRARYEKQAMAIDAVIAQDKTHTLEVLGSIPLALSWQDGWRAEPLPGMNLRARSNGLSLAFLNALKPEAVQSINGELALDVMLRGRLDAPAPSGTFQLRNGGLEAKRLGLKLSGITAEGNADPQRITIAQLVARSGDEGTLAGSGAVELRNFAPESINLSVKARRWPAIQSERYRATVNGNFKVNGPITAPRVTGAVQVIEGSIRPDLEAFNRTGVSLARDPTIVVVQHRGGKPIHAEPSAKNGENNGVPLEQIVLDITVTIPDNFWIRHSNANIELKGKLHVGKKPETDLSVSGTVQLVRGWVGLQGRRFTLTEGTIVFTGGKPSDATVDVTAEYRVNNYLVNAEVTGTTEKPKLTLTSQPQLEQSDILSLLLFGKPVADLTTGQQVSVQERAADVGAGFAAATLGKAVSEALGLEALGFDLSDVSFSGGQVRFGRYVGDRTYIAISQEVSGDRRHEVTVEYQIAPDWRLGATSASEGRSGVDIIWQKRY